MNTRRKGRAFEQRVAKVLGVEPTCAASYVAAPDLPAITLPSGERVQVEAKNRGVLYVPRFFPQRTTRIVPENIEKSPA